ncbi:unnamed protein product [Notodromas monacha]|uniref:FHA domain-containing protein n=1 Tax=Notodromas monacha TaxID=399045 RepID=A0A7R9GAX3_9CRUS|nr:unnamed protein product [Notodromas monacha]CAG0915915.1 unnamed protein product [Notodromas monacha]
MSSGKFAIPSLSKHVPTRRSSSRAIKRKTFDDQWEAPVNATKLLKGPDGVGIGYSGSPSSTPSTPGMSSGASFAEMAVAGTSYAIAPTIASARRQKDASSTSVTSGFQSGLAVNPGTSRANTKKRIKGKKKPANAIELGRFKPIDDLALINAVLQTNDLEVIHKSVKFTCEFTFRELTQRWHQLLYDSTLSKMAVQAIQNLHPETVCLVQSKALFSRAEENLLAEVTFDETKFPSLSDFSELLRQNPSVFHPGRTPKTLMKHWNMMKNYDLLKCQSLSTSGDRTFFDVLATISVPDHEPHEDVPLRELQAQGRSVRLEIRKLEKEVQEWETLARSVTGQATLPAFDDQTVALLQGRLTCYKMKSKEVSFGRSVKGGFVDFDLSLEGPSAKISRRQGTIKLRPNGDFFIQNDGKRAILVDGKPVLPHHKFKLHENAVIQMCRTLQLIFHINEPVVEVIRERARVLKETRDLQKKQKLELELLKQAGENHGSDFLPEIKTEMVESPANLQDDSVPSIAIEKADDDESIPEELYIKDEPLTEDASEELGEKSGDLYIPSASDSYAAVPRIEPEPNLESGATEVPPRRSTASPENEDSSSNNDEVGDGAVKQLDSESNASEEPKPPAHVADEVSVSAPELMDTDESSIKTESSNPIEAPLEESGESKDAVELDSESNASEEPKPPAHVADEVSVSAPELMDTDESSIKTESSNPIEAPLEESGESKDAVEVSAE